MPTLDETQLSLDLRPPQFAFRPQRILLSHLLGLDHPAELLAKVKHRPRYQRALGEQEQAHTFGTIDRSRGGATLLHPTGPEPHYRTLPVQIRLALPTIAVCLNAHRLTRSVL